jgi:hypothetical protein
MTIIYLQPGQRFTQSGGMTRVGTSGTSSDTGIDWNEVAAYNENDFDKNDDEDGLVGQIRGSGYRVPGKKEDGLTFEVYLDKRDGRFYYDDECGF